MVKRTLSALAVLGSLVILLAVIGGLWGLVTRTVADLGAVLVLALVVVLLVAGVVAGWRGARDVQTAYW